MLRVLLLCVIVLVVHVALSHPSGAETRQPILEFVTNTGAAPGPAAAEAWHSLLDTYPNLLAIEHHAWWPFPGDPFYLVNPTEQRDRVFYYGITVVPSSHIDGIRVPNPVSSASYEAILDLRPPAAVTLRLDGTFDPTTQSGELRVSAIPATPYDAVRTLRVAFIQDNVVLDPPGPNGRSHFDWLFRRYLPDHDGTEMFLRGAADTTHVALTFSITAEAGEPLQDLALVAFLQHDATRDVEQGAMIRLLDMLPPTAVLPTSWTRIKAQFRERNGRSEAIR